LLGSYYIETLDNYILVNLFLFSYFLSV